MGDIYEWQGGTGDVANAANWFDVTTGQTATAPPGPNDTAELLGTGTLYGTGAVGTLDISATTGSGFSLAATLSAASISVNGALSLEFGAHIEASQVSIGGTASQIFTTVLQGSALTGIAGRLDLTLSSAGQAPILEVAGTGALVDLGSGTAIVGSGTSQNGSLIVAAGGVFRGEAGSGLTLGVAGGLGLAEIMAGGTASIGGLVQIGDGGTGFLKLDSGAQFSAGGGTGAALMLGVEVQGQPQANGFLQANSATITLDGQAQIGVSASGSFGLTDGSLTTLGGVVLGVGPALGMLSLGGSASWHDTGAVTIGPAGGGTLTIAGTGASPDTIDGVLTIDNGLVSLSGGTLQMLGETVMGPIGSATLLVGVQATWDSSGQTISLTGQDFLDVSGTASVLEAGAIDAAASASIFLQSGASVSVGTAAGAAALSLRGASLSIDQASLSVFGAATLEGGGHALSMQDGTLTLKAAGTALTIGGGADVTVEGTASVIHAQGGIVVEDTNSFVEIDGGALAASSRTGPALQVAAGASLVLTGGTLRTTGGLLVGGAAPDGQGGGGTLIAHQGVTLVSATGQAGGLAAIVGGADQGTDEVLLEGARWSVLGDMVIAPGGTSSAGVVSLLGGALRVSGTLSVGAQGGHGTLSGGAVHAGALVVGQFGVVETAHLTVAGNADIAGTAQIASGGIATHGTLTLERTGQITGHGRLAGGSIVDLGTITASGGRLGCIGPVSGTGTLAVTQDSTLFVKGIATSGLTMDFEVSSSRLVLGDVAGFAADIVGGVQGDTIDLQGLAAASETYAGHTLSLFGPGHSLLATLWVTGGYTSKSFALSSDGHGGTAVHFTGG